MLGNIKKYWALIWGLLSAKKEITKAMQENNWKSTKFFITIINIVLSLVAVGLKFIPAQTGLWVIFGISALYFVANVIAKITPSKKDDEFLAALRDSIIKLGIKPEETPVVPAPETKKEEVK